MSHLSSFISKLGIYALGMVCVLSSCQQDSKTTQAEPEAIAEVLPEGPLYKLFTSADVDMQIQISFRSLAQKAGLPDSLLLPMAHDSILMADSLIARLPDEVQAFLDGFSPVDGWADPLLPQLEYDLLIYSNDEEEGDSYLSVLFIEGQVDLKMYNYRSFNSMYTLPDDLKLIQLPRNVGAFRYKVHGDSLITASIQLANKEQNALLTLRQLSDQLTDDYDTDDYTE